MGLPADRDDVEPAVAVEVGDGEILDRHTAVLEDVLAPLRAFVINGLVDPDAAALSRLLTSVVPNTDDQLVAAIAVQIGAPDCVPPAQRFIHNVPVPERLLGIVRRRIDDDLVAVPRLDGGDEFPTSPKLTLLDFAGPSAALGVGLVACTDQTPGPSGSGVRKQRHPL